MKSNVVAIKKISLAVLRAVIRGAALRDSVVCDAVISGSAVVMSEGACDTGVR